MGTGAKWVNLNPGSKKVAILAPPWHATIYYNHIFNLFQSRIQDQLHKIQYLVFNVLKRMMKSDREVALAWLATLISMNEMRTSITDQTIQIRPRSKNEMQAACSDGKGYPL